MPAALAAGAGPVDHHRQDPLPAQGQARHLPAHGRRPAADGSVRLQAADGRVVRQGPARLGPDGPAADDHDLGPEAVPDRPVEVQVRPARQVRHVGLRAAAVHGQDGRRHVLHPQHAHRGDQPRAGHHATCRPATRSPAGPAWAPGPPTASARSTRTCRRSSCSSPSRRTPSRSRRSPPGCGRRATCRRARRRLVPQRRRPDPLHQQPAGRPADVRRNTLDGLKALNEMNYKQVGDPETHTRIEQYELAFRMQSSVPELTEHRERARLDLHPLRRGGQEARDLRPHRAAGPADGRARRPVRPDLPQQLGPRTPTSPAACPSQCKDVDQACWGLIQDLKAARAVRRDAGHLGRRVRPDDLLAGRPVARELRPRPPPALLHHVDGRRRHRRPGRSTARPTTSRYNIVKDPVHIHDFHATVLHLLGFDHRRFSYRYQGLDQRLTGVEPARVIKELLA